MYTYQLAENKIIVLSHDAMATIYELHIIHDDKNYVAQAALEAFTQLDQIEQDLSRFVENSDISHINNLKYGESVVVSLHTFSCLKTAVEYYYDTDKIFDIAYGSDIRCMKEDFEPQNATANGGSQLENLELNENERSVTLKGKSIDLDLGGIGKGYAIDELKKLLHEWGLHRTLLHGGKSTVLAMNAPDQLDGWPLSISHPLPPHVHLQNLHIKECAMSSSGLQKGDHIIDPRIRSQAENHLATWVLSPSATISDILSTTFMIMNRKEIEEFCSEFPEISYICVNMQGEIYRKGI